jgi:hypothetical protein
MPQDHSRERKSLGGGVVLGLRVDQSRVSRHNYGAHKHKQPEKVLAPGSGKEGKAKDHYREGILTW